VKLDFDQLRRILGIGAAGYAARPDRSRRKHPHRGRAGGGNTFMRPARFLSNPIPPPAREYIGKRRNLSARKKRRLRYLASIQDNP
jgi:hypothetical protein